MRMWMVNPAIMCRKHLLGEHVEIHMFQGCLNKGKNVDGYVKNGLVDLGFLKVRHSALVDEMTRRGYKHNSPLIIQAEDSRNSVNWGKSLNELINRCPDCHDRFSEFYLKKDSIVTNKAICP